MRFVPTAIPDVVVVEPDVFGDDRGFLMETWHARKFAAGGIDAMFVQENHSRSAAGTLRGLHYQIHQPQGKLVRVLAGEVFDVTVDLRRSSPTFGRWTAILLSAEQRRQLWIPPGFAHGFYVTSEVTEFVYKCTDFYAPEHERTIRWDDPDLAINWPLLEGQPILSQKDTSGVRFKEAEYFA